MVEAAAGYRRQVGCRHGAASPAARRAVRPPPPDGQCGAVNPAACGLLLTRMLLGLLVQPTTPTAATCGEAAAVLSKARPALLPLLPNLTWLTPGCI
jgi:hypothetical protein